MSRVLKGTGVALLTIAALLALQIQGCGTSSTGDGGSTEAAPQDAGGTPDSGNAKDTNAKPQDQSAPTIDFQKKESFLVLKGKASVDVTATDDVGVTKVELLADGKVVATVDKAPFSLSWDTTGATDGLVKIKAVAYDASGKSTSTKEVQALVMNNGQDALMIDGYSGKMSIPQTGTGDFHKKHHWIMPAGVKKLVTWATWDDAAWKIRVDLGTGGCPHSGKTYTSKSSDTGGAVVVWEVKSGTLPTGQWFIHLAGLNESEMRGKSMNYKVRGYLLK